MTPAIPTSMRTSGQTSDRTYVIGSFAELEQALQSPPLNQWETVLDGDPSATLFQSPVWLIPWYRSYHGFEPRVLVVVRGGELAGVVPLAVETATGRLTFGGDEMTDYRDIVTVPKYRREVVSELLRYYKQGGFPNVLHFGSTMPESETPGVLTAIAAGHGVRTLAHSNDGWRWWPHEQTEDLLKKKSIRYAVNYLRRQGTLEVDVVRSAEEWALIKEEFYRQHSLRQLFGERQVTFNDPRKRAFFDELIRTPYGHITALRLNGELIAAHVGSVYRGVLYWGAPSFDIRYRQYSPNLVLLTLTMKNWEAWGLAGVDLTVGKGHLKERCSTSRVDLPWIELYADSRQYFERKLKTAVVRTSRQIIERAAGAESWTERIKPRAAKAAVMLERVREKGIAQSLAAAGRVAARRIGEHRRGVVLIARPEDARETHASLEPGETCDFHENELNDLLKRDIWDDAAAREIAAKVRAFTDLARAGKTFHTVLVNGRLAGWGISHWPQEPSKLTEVGDAILEYAPQSIALYDFYTLPEFRGRKLYQALLGHILALRFGEGAKQAYITVLASNAPSLAAIERVGFRRVTINEVWRFGKWKHVRTSGAG